MARGKHGSWLRYGCFVVLGIAAIVAVVVGVVLGIAVRQNSSAEFEQQALAPQIEMTGLAEEARPPVRLRLEIHTAGVSVKPIDAGESIRIDADYDPRLHRLRQSNERDGTVEVLIVELRPLGSELMALLRTKVGGRL